jgi:hypothetical protein
VDVAIKVYFTDFYDVADPPCKNMNHICDLPFCGSDK